mmetsp:Transcript_14185/g.42905  ORF Transcript_14185/g.42905 Transcript_14185/m.42905 type:complete len:254 (+) Transcript_14185:514-1275(+)
MLLHLIHMMFIASTTMTVHHDCSLALQHSQMTAAAYATITQASFQAANNMDFGFALQPVSNDVIALYGGVPYPSKSLANAANSTSVHDQLAVLMYSVGCHPGNTLSWACEVLPYQCSSTTVGPRDVFFDLLHQRCGHYHDGYLHMLPKLTIGCPPIKPGSKTSFCPGCALGSHQRSSVHGAAIPRAVLPFLTIWTDIMFINRRSRFGNYNNTCAFIDDCTRSAYHCFGADKQSTTLRNHAAHFLRRACQRSGS